MGLNPKIVPSDKTICTSIRQSLMMSLQTVKLYNPKLYHHLPARLNLCPVFVKANKKQVEIFKLHFFFNLNDLPHLFSILLHSGVLFLSMIQIFQISIKPGVMYVLSKSTRALMSSRLYSGAPLCAVLLSAVSVTRSQLPSKSIK